MLYPSLCLVSPAMTVKSAPAIARIVPPLSEYGLNARWVVSMSVSGTNRDIGPRHYLSEFEYRSYRRLSNLIYDQHQHDLLVWSPSRSASKSDRRRRLDAVDCGRKATAAAASNERSEAFMKVHCLVNQDADMVAAIFPK